MAKKAAAVNPFSMGGGGDYFDRLVAIYYLLRLMRQEAPRGMPDALIKEVGLQQKNRDCPIDDIVLYCETSTGIKKRLCLQVKHNITFSKNDDFIKVVNEVWDQLSDKNFKNDDSVGLAIGEVCNNSTVKRHVAELLEWAKTSSTPDAFYQKTLKFKTKTNILNAFEAGIKKVIGKKPTKIQVHHLLKHFIVLSFDFTARTGRDTLDCIHLLQETVGDKDFRKATSLHAILYKMATDFAINGGEITRNSLAERISAEATFKVPVLQQAGESITAILTKRLQNRIAAEKNSKKYIPEIFIEVGDVKEKARIFCHPALFLEKLLYEFESINLYEINRLLKHSGLKPLEFNLNFKKFKFNFEHTDKNIIRFQKIVENISRKLSALDRKSRTSLIRQAPKLKRHIIEETSWHFCDKAHSLNEHVKELFLEKSEIAKAKVFAIVSKAGQGKTNFVCDLAENCLTKRSIPCVFFTGKELANVSHGELQNYFARGIYGNNGLFDTVLQDINEEARRRGTAGIILFDAINEHPEIKVFSSEIERFIEKCIEYSHIRVILTCRSEYFDIRFGNLLKSSFANKMIIEREIHRHMSEEHKQRLVRGYLKFFKIYANRISEHAFKQFENDPFLLRVFCEAYGDHTAKSLKRIPFIRHIRREEIFHKYFQKKFGDFNDQTPSINTPIGKQRPYWAILKKIISWMIKQNIYSDVPFSIFDTDQSKLLLELIDEDILLRKDIDTNKIFVQNEVINFTFDTCRDFLISNYLINIVLKEDAAKFKHLVEKLTVPKLTVAEGLQEYLFFALRQKKENNAIDIIKYLPWYQNVFYEHIFELDEEAITADDDKVLKEACNQNNPTAPHIVANLLCRYDSQIYPHANIFLLFDIFDTVNDDTFQFLCKYTFDKYLGIYPIDRLVEHLKPLLLGNKWDAAYKGLVRILLYLWNIEGYDYMHPVQDIFWEFKQRRPKIATQIMNNHIMQHLRGFKKDCI